MKRCPICKKDKSEEQFDNLSDYHICNSCFGNMRKYRFKWKVEDGLNKIHRGEDILETNRDITQEELNESISDSGSSGNDYIDENWIIGGKLLILVEINTCDAGCRDWEIYKLKEIGKGEFHPKGSLN